jgi:hypothetical protein
MVMGGMLIGSRTLTIQSPKGLLIVDPLIGW